MHQSVYHPPAQSETCREPDGSMGSGRSGCLLHKSAFNLWKRAPRQTWRFGNVFCFRETAFAKVTIAEDVSYTEHKKRLKCFQIVAFLKVFNDCKIAFRCLNYGTVCVFKPMNLLWIRKMLHSIELCHFWFPKRSLHVCQTTKLAVFALVILSCLHSHII